MRARIRGEGRWQRRWQEAGLRGMGHMIVETIATGLAHIIIIIIIIIIIKEVGNEQGGERVIHTLSV